MLRHAPFKLTSPESMPYLPIGKRVKFIREKVHLGIFLTFVVLESVRCLAEGENEPVPFPLLRGQSLFHPARLRRLFVTLRELHFPSRLHQKCRVITWENRSGFHLLGEMKSKRTANAKEQVTALMLITEK